MTTANTKVNIIQSIVLDASREQVWSLVGDFFKLESFAPVDRTEKVSDTTRYIFATETHYVTEDLLTYHHDAVETKGQSYYSYNMHIAQDLSTFPFPLQPFNYWAEIRVIDVTLSSTDKPSVAVVWTAHFDVESEEASQVIKPVIDGLFTASLQNLKKLIAA